MRPFTVPERPGGQHRSTHTNEEQEHQQNGNSSRAPPRQSTSSTTHTFDEGLYVHPDDELPICKDGSFSLPLSLQHDHSIRGVPTTARQADMTRPNRHISPSTTYQPKLSDSSPAVSVPSQRRQHHHQQPAKYNCMPQPKSHNSRIPSMQSACDSSDEKGTTDNDGRDITNSAKGLAHVDAKTYPILAGQKVNELERSQSQPLQAHTTRTIFQMPSFMNLGFLSIKIPQHSKNSPPRSAKSAPGRLRSFSRSSTGEDGVGGIFEAPQGNDGNIQSTGMVC